MIFTGTGNANKILGIPVQTGTPSDTFTLLYDAASNRWVFGPSGTPPAGGVGGGANLTTVGSIPFVTAAGVLGQSANFRWDNANNRFGVGTSSPGFLTHFVGISGTDSGWSRTTWQDATNVTRSNWINGAGFATIGTITADPFVFVASNTESFRIAATTRNLLLGTPTDDGTNRLQVAGSVYTTGPLRVDNNDGFLGNLTTGTFLNIGSLGDANNVWVDARGTGANVGMNFRTKGSGLFSWFNTTAGVSLMTLSSTGELNVRNQAPTVGSTSLVVRAGAGQGTNLLQQWQNSSGSSRLQVTSSLGMQALGTFFAVQDSAGTINRAILQSTLDLNNTYAVRWSSTGDATGAPDLSLSRASANTLQVGDGGSNSNGIILSQRVQSAGETVASLPAAAAGNAGTISYVTDSNSTTIGATVAGGGANKVLVWSNGTAWRIFAN